MNSVSMCKNIAKGQLICQDLIDSNGKDCGCLRRLGTITITQNFRGTQRVRKIKKILDKIG